MDFKKPVSNKIMKNLLRNFLFVTCLGSCTFLGEKNKVSDYIQKPDYSLKSVEYVPIVPNIGTGIKPVSLYAGYDELIYAVDSGQAIISYDMAGNQLGKLTLPGVQFVIQNRSLDLFALGRLDTTIQTVNFNLPVIYKISQKVNPTEIGDPVRLDLNLARVVKKMVYPFCINESQKLQRKTQLEATKLSSIGFMADNSYYISSSGPQEDATEPYITRRNSILTFSKGDNFQGGFTEGDAQKSIGAIGLTTLVQPPQRARMEERLDFIYTSFTSDIAISVRYLEVVNTPDGLVYNFKVFGIPSPRESDGYLYDPFRFEKPSAVLYAGTSQKYIFVADEGKDSIFVFQENGYEGAIPPPQYTNRKLIKVSFGGTGNGPLQFNRPVALAFANRTLFVADAGNRRIVRFKLTSDYE